MNAVILCAGFATRMYPLTRDFPKPLLRVGCKTVLDYLMEEIVDLPGLKTIHIVSNARFYEHFKNWCELGKSEGRFGDKDILIHNNGCLTNETRRGAASDLQFGLSKIKEQTKTLVAGGDNIFRFSLQPLWQRFMTSEHHLIAALNETDPIKLRRTGVLELREDNQVVRLHEKPADPQSTWTSPPLYCFQPTVVDVLKRFIQSPGNHDAPGYFIDYLSQIGRVEAFKILAGRYDIGCLETYRQADRELSQTEHWKEEIGQVM